MFAILLCHMTTCSLFNSFNEVAGKFMTFGSIFVCVSFVAFVNLRWDRLSFVESILLHGSEFGRRDIELCRSLVELRLC